MAFFVMLETDRLVIRPARTSDADPLFEVYGDAETMRYWDSLPDADASVTARRVAGMMRQQAPVTYFAFETRGKVVGTGGVHHGTEVGFILHRKYWRQGLMSEALGALLPYLFGVLAVDHLTADVDPRNEASQALLVKTGFRETGRAARSLRVGAQWCDSVYLRLDRADAPG